MEDIKQNSKIAIGIGAGVIACLIIVIIFRFYDRNKSYSSYKVAYNLEIADSVDNKFYPYSTGILKYCSDGISYIDEGREVWNHGFEMKNPTMDICGEFVAVAEVGSNDINIYNTTGENYQVATSYPIQKLEVSRQGVVSAVLADETANYIEVISKDGTQIAIGRTALEGDGYPIDISLSDDATKVAASYLAISSGEAKTKLVFYNYSEVGQEQTDRIVGGFNDFGSSIIPNIEFVTEDKVIAMGDNVLAIYSIEETPSEIARVKLESEVKSVAYNNKYIATVVEEGDKLEKKLVIYDINGEKVLSKKLNFAYTDISMAEESVVFTNDTDCMIMSVQGVEKFNYRFTMGITDIVPQDDKNMILVSGKTIQKITLD